MKNKKISFGAFHLHLRVKIRQSHAAFSFHYGISVKTQVQFVWIILCLWKCVNIFTRFHASMLGSSMIFVWLKKWVNDCISAIRVEKKVRLVRTEQYFKQAGEWASGYITDLLIGEQSEVNGKSGICYNIFHKHGSHWKTIWRFLTSTKSKLSIFAMENNSKHPCGFEKMKWTRTLQLELKLLQATSKHSD